MNLEDNQKPQYVQLEKDGDRLFTLNGWVFMSPILFQDHDPLVDETFGDIFDLLSLN